MKKIEAVTEFMRAVIRAQEARCIESWSLEALRGVYAAASTPGISFEAWCELLDYQIEPEGDALLDENEAALQALEAEQQQGGPVQVVRD